MVVSAFTNHVWTKNTFSRNQWLVIWVFRMKRKQCEVSEYLLFAYQAVWVLKSKVFGQKSTVVKWNYQILCLHPVIVGQTVPVLDFHSEFSVSKIVRIFLIFFSLKNNCLWAHFL
jgi:hypothetical protein